MSQRTVIGGFEPLTNRNLAKITVVAQCLDNQWVTRDLLDHMVTRRLSYEDVEGRRQQDARAEYLRSLLNAEQVIVNRAYFFNNPVVYQDFLKYNVQRDAFRTLMNERALIPFLLRERSPEDEPGFTLDSVGWPAWRKLLGDLDTISCLRLSWDDAENEECTQRLMYEEFHRFLLQLRGFNLDALRRDLGLDEASTSLLKQRLREVTLWAADIDRADREGFYREFLVEPGTFPAQGRFRSEPLVSELKQLIDLRYNTTVPDAVERYALIPTDSLRRTALQERPPIRRKPAAGAGAPAGGLPQLLDLLAALRPQAFDLAQSPLRLDLTGLTLDHIRQARNTEEWRSYLSALEALLDDPTDFVDRGQKVFDQYVALARRLADIVGRRRTSQMRIWEPAIRITVEVLGASVSLIYDGNPRLEVLGEVATEVAARGAEAIVRFAVVGRDQRRAEDEVSTGIDVMKVRLERAREEWAELVRRMREGGFPITEGPAVRDAEPNMDQPRDDE
ncbi:hypothetical protein GA0070558_11246 [Micromonospora haikouensis]|uniref:Uncharacterized protein n=1 Tax=Micromonospora haikouensis TaxID=686309 RepID=A0A1C4VYA7_9ACTN|nr:hypothetical protein [Micromonospora haikouensis]SCE88996.1 hypothetical protein GA0070558_11246 [Micromonospora haikouensis]